MKLNKHITKIKRKQKRYIRPLPEGIERYDEENMKYIGLKKIIVGSEWDKQQLLLASEYIHYLKELDTDIIGANLIAHIYTTPEIIEVDNEKEKHEKMIESLKKAGYVFDMNE